MSLSFSLPRHVFLSADSDLTRALRDTYLGNGLTETWKHVNDVAAVCRTLSAQFGLEPESCALSGLLHDVSAVLTPPEMRTAAEEMGWILDPAEERYPFLLHQKLSREIARDVFGVTDHRVLSAVACHTTLHADPLPEEMALFIADKIAWDQPGIPPYLSAVQEALQQSLAKACAVYIDDAMAAGRILFPHQDLLRARAAL